MTRYLIISSILFLVNLDVVAQKVFLQKNKLIELVEFMEWQNHFNIYNTKLDSVYNISVGSSRSKLNINNNKPTYFLYDSIVILFDIGPHYTLMLNIFDLPERKYYKKRTNYRIHSLYDNSPFGEYPRDDFSLQFTDFQLSFDLAVDDQGNPMMFVLQDGVMNKWRLSPIYKGKKVPLRERRWELLGSIPLKLAQNDVFYVFRKGKNYYIYCNGKVYLEQIDSYELINDFSNMDNKHCAMYDVDNESLYLLDGNDLHSSIERKRKKQISLDEEELIFQRIIEKGVKVF